MCDVTSASVPDGAFELLDNGVPQALQPLFAEHQRLLNLLAQAGKSDWLEVLRVFARGTERVLADAEEVIGSAALAVDLAQRAAAARFGAPLASEPRGGVLAGPGGTDAPAVLARLVHADVDGIRLAGSPQPVPFADASGAREWVFADGCSAMFSGDELVASTVIWPTRDKFHRVFLTPAAAGSAS